MSTTNQTLPSDISTFRISTVTENCCMRTFVILMIGGPHVSLFLLFFTALY